MTPSNSSLPPDVLTSTDQLVGRLHDDNDDCDGPEISSFSLTSSTSRRPAQSTPRRPTAISYECGSLTYFAALLEEMNGGEDDDGDDDDDQDGENNHNIDNVGNTHRTPAADDGSRFLQKIQDRLIEKHVRNGTIRPRTIRIVRDDDRQDPFVAANRASAPASSATRGNARRGRRRLGGSNPRSIIRDGMRADRDASIKSRVVYSFRSGEGE